MPAIFAITDILKSYLILFGEFFKSEIFMLLPAWIIEVLEAGLQMTEK